MGDLPFLLFDLKLAVRTRVGWVLVVSLGVIGKLSHPKPPVWFFEPVDDAGCLSTVDRSEVGNVDVGMVGGTGAGVLDAPAVGSHFGVSRNRGHGEEAPATPELGPGPVLSTGGVLLRLLRDPAHTQSVTHKKVKRSVLYITTREDHTQTIEKFCDTYTAHAYVPVCLLEYQFEGGVDVGVFEVEAFGVVPGVGHILSTTAVASAGRD